MIYRGQATLLALTLTLGGIPVLAQQAPAADADAATRVPATGKQPGEEPQEQATAASADEPGQADKPAANGKDSPFDYRSSEEISEDLSVSFPVDI